MRGRCQSQLHGAAQETQHRLVFAPTRLFDEQEVALRGVPGIAAADPAEVPALLAPYREALDNCVVRALPAGDAPEDWLAIAEAATLPS